MYKNAKPLFLICETPMHVGSGSDLGIVDLPIQRERHTGFPKIEASSLKGALREAFESAFKIDKNTENRLKIHRTFGYDKDGILDGDKSEINNFFGDDTQFAGALSLTDARLLLFPVKSLYGVFAWITCPRILLKFEEELNLCGFTVDFQKIEVNSTTSKAEILKYGKAYLEEFVFTVNKDKEANKGISKVATWLKNNMFSKDDKSYCATKIEKDIIVLGDNDFRDFVNLATEVITRTKINNNTGTVAQSALFSEEYLPAESIMYSLTMFTDEFTKNTSKMKAKKVKETDADGVTEFFEYGLNQNGNIVQIGANATLGKGIVKTKFMKEETK